MSEKDIHYLYNSRNEFQGVMIPAALWELISDRVEAEAARVLPPAEPRDPADEALANEPVRDWERFLQFWDFRYPPENSVVCRSCGSKTQDWTVDQPRKFILKAASIGGLVAFHCCSCGARVLKRHFKDSVKFEYQKRTFD
ncbi:MAG: hypothetical protein ACLFSY_00390 [Desulfonatronovibrionaceae bacterium]